MHITEFDYTWRSELESLTRRILDILDVPHTRRHLDRVVDLEDECAFGSMDRPPASTAPLYERETRDPAIQIEAVTRVLEAFDVWTDVFRLDFAGAGPDSATEIPDGRSDRAAVGGSGLPGATGLTPDDVPALLLLDATGESPDPRWVLLRAMGPTYLDIVDAGGHSVPLPSAGLQSRWTGVIATFRRFEESGQTDLARHRAAATLATAWRWLGTAAAVVIAAVVSASVLRSPGIVGPLTVAWGVLGATGLALAVQLKRIETTGEYRSRALERFCRLREGFNCQRLLSLPGAKFLGVIGWSDVGIVFFVATLALLVLAGLLPSFQSSFLGMAAVAVTAALPYTIYSVVYQWFVARTGCMLCLSVQVILWAQFAVALLSYRAGALAVPPVRAVLLWVATLLFAVLWVIERSRRLDISMDARRYQVRHLAFARDAALFTARLDSGFRVDTTVLPGELTFGTGDEQVRVLAVLDPGCRFCAAAWRRLQQIRERMDGAFGLQVRLVTEKSGLDTWRDLLALTLAGREVDAKQLLDRWYLRVIELRRRGWISESGRLDPGHYAQWKDEVGFPVREETAEVDAAFARYTEWEKSHFIEKWPELFVNGHYWPASHPYDPYLHIFFEDIEEWARQ